jgi:hypothetical protein
MCYESHVRLRVVLRAISLALLATVVATAPGCTCGGCSEGFLAPACNYDKFVAYCDGNTAVTCGNMGKFDFNIHLLSSTHEFRTDCGSGFCMLDPGSLSPHAAHCWTPCDPTTFDESCHDNQRRFCNASRSSVPVVDDERCWDKDAGSSLECVADSSSHPQRATCTAWKAALSSPRPR